jgi:hypothetical protein
MARKIQRSDSHGSLKQLQLLVNNRQDLLDQRIKESINSFTNDNIIWKSPLQDDDYAEYTDNDFLTRIGFDPDEINLHEFWPQRGANWDALATTDKGKIVLVEAKANIPEMVSPPSGAGEVSMTMIQNALNETKEYLNKNTVIDWAGKFYQYTNRIAHLYFLRVKKNKKAFLINIYFVGDQSVDGPKTVEEWKGAIQVMNLYLGLNSHKLKKYMADIFIDLTDLK